MLSALLLLGQKLEDLADFHLNGGVMSQILMNKLMVVYMISGQKIHGVTLSQTHYFILGEIMAFVITIVQVQRKNSKVKYSHIKKWMFYV